jgi:hypothetical protein
MPLTLFVPTTKTSNLTQVLNVASSNFADRGKNIIEVIVTCSALSCSVSYFPTGKQNGDIRSIQNFTVGNTKNAGVMCDKVLCRSP